MDDKCVMAQKAVELIDEIAEASGDEKLGLSSHQVDAMLESAIGMFVES